MNADPKRTRKRISTALLPKYIEFYRRFSVQSGVAVNRVIEQALDLLIEKVDLDEPEPEPAAHEISFFTVAPEQWEHLFNFVRLAVKKFTEAGMSRDDIVIEVTAHTKRDPNQANALMEKILMDLYDILPDEIMRNVAGGVRPDLISARYPEDEAHEDQAVQ